MSSKLLSCPDCRKELQKIDYKMWGTKRFDSKTGSYEENPTDHRAGQRVPLQARLENHPLGGITATGQPELCYLACNTQFRLSMQEGDCDLHKPCSIGAEYGTVSSIGHNPQ